MNQTFENCTLLDTVTWFEKAIPKPTVKNFTTQLGVHFEEVREMVLALEGVNPVAENLLSQAAVALRNLGDHLKQNAGSVRVNDPLEMLDGLCDQIVTATGTGHMLGYKMVQAMTEVNASNFSKFDEKGNPIFNENGKIMKGDLFRKPNLLPYL